MSWASSSLTAPEIDCLARKERASALDPEATRRPEERPLAHPSDGGVPLRLDLEQRPPRESLAPPSPATRSATGRSRAPRRPRAADGTPRRGVRPGPRVEGLPREARPQPHSAGVRPRAAQARLPLADDRQSLPCAVPPSGRPRHRGVDRAHVHRGSHRLRPRALPAHAPDLVRRRHRGQRPRALVRGRIQRPPPRERRATRSARRSVSPAARDVEALRDERATPRARTTSPCASAHWLTVHEVRTHPSLRLARSPEGIRPDARDARSGRCPCCS